MKVTHIKAGEVDDSLKGSPLILTLPKKDGGEYQKRVYDKTVAGGWQGPGNYEIKWQKNDKGFFDIVGLNPAGTVTNPSNGNKSTVVNQSEKERNLSIIAQVALKEAVAFHAGNEKRDLSTVLVAAGTFHEWLLEHADPEFGKDKKANLEVVTKAFPGAKVSEEEEVPF